MPAERVASAGEKIGPTVTLGDGLNASVGDWITTRSNARWLRSGDRTWVKNGHRWIIRGVEADGSLTVSPLRGEPDATVRLPAHYVAAHTGLGYAATIDTRQGVTADTCHVVGSDHLSRQHLYVALTRGRQENHLYFSTAEADPHRILTPKAIHPPTAVDILTAILRRDGAPQSAHSAAQTAVDPFTRLGPAASMYLDALGAAVEHTVGTATMTRIDTAAMQLGVGVVDCEAWPVLRRHLALLALEGYDPAAELERAVAVGDLSDVRAPAAVLDWRLPNAGAAGTGPLFWLDPIPDVLAADPQWGPYLAARADLVADLAAQVRDTAHHWSPEVIPQWGRPLMDHPRVLAEVAVFRATHGVDPADSRTTGPQQHANRSARAQKAIHARVNQAMPLADPGTRRWRRLAERCDRRITTDPYWPQLAAHLDGLAGAGADINGLLHRAMNAGPLPDELPAAALWWRLAGRISPDEFETARSVDDEKCSETETLDLLFAPQSPADVREAAQRPRLTAAELEELRCRRDAARAAVATLEAAIFSGTGGPAERSAGAEIAALHRRHVQQRPYQHRLAHAHTDWLAAEHTHDQHHRLLDQLDKQIEAAQSVGDDALAATYRQHRTELARHTAVIIDHRDFCRAERRDAHRVLLDAAGGTEGIVTEDDLQRIRRQAIDTDLDSLRLARLEARELDNQLYRAEATAARAFAQAAAVHDGTALEQDVVDDYHVDADLEQLRAEVAILEVAGTRSPAAVYDWEPADTPSPETEKIVASIADSDMTVQAIRIDACMDKHGVFRGVALAAHRSKATVHASPGSEASSAFAVNHRYSHRYSHRLGPGVDAPSVVHGDLVIVDDADHLTAEHLEALVKRASETNTKVLLAISADAAAGRSRHLVDALVENLPWGIAGDIAVGRGSTAMRRITEHLASGDRQQTEEERTAQALIKRRDHLAQDYRELAAPKQWRSVPTQSVERNLGVGL